MLESESAIHQLAKERWGETVASKGSVWFDGEEWYFWNPDTGDRYYIEWVDDGTPKFAGENSD